MKRVLLSTVALFLCARAFAQTPPPAPQPQPQAATPAPAVKVEQKKFLPEELLGRELRDLGGRAFSLADYRGRVYVVNVWASWCGPCHAEIPGLNKIYEDYRGRGVEFLGLTTEDPSTDAGRVRGVAEDLKMKYRIGWLDHETATSLLSWGPTARGRFAIPQTFVVGADGHVVLHVRGYNPRVPEMVRAGVRRALALAEPPEAPAAPAAPETSPAPGS